VNTGTTENISTIARINNSFVPRNISALLILASCCITRSQSTNHTSHILQWYHVRSVSKTSQQLANKQQKLFVTTQQHTTKQQTCNDELNCFTER